MKVFYTGVGNRDTPYEFLEKMTTLASLLEKQGCILRSGGAEGADTAFENGVKYVQNKEVYLPWPFFNNRIFGDIPSPEWISYIDEILSRIHPNFSNLRESTLKLHRRNVLQILGQDLATPSHFILCYTRDGAETSTSPETGGTGTVIRLANQYGIPVFNLRNKDWAERFKEFMKS